MFQIMHGRVSKFRAWALAAAVAFTQYAAPASEPQVVAGNWERVGEVDWLLRDPLTAQPVALLEAHA